MIQCTMCSALIFQISVSDPYQTILRIEISTCMCNISSCDIGTTLSISGPLPHPLVLFLMLEIQENFNSFYSI